MTASTDDVRRYYDANSRKFERLGQGATTIRRAVWGPGVTTRAASFEYVDEQIIGELDGLASKGKPRVLDLGCGLGASLRFIAGKRSIEGEGITISGVQAARATELLEASEFRGAIRIREGNFLALPADLAGVDLAFSIEAFIHTPDQAGYFREAAQAIRSGGRLVICDDFRSERPDGELAQRERRNLEEFKQGWRVGSLSTAAQAVALAAQAGFQLRKDTDLSGQLELERPRDKLVALAAFFTRHLHLRGEYLAMLMGGHALQRGLLGGTLTYRILVFERG